MSKILQVGLEKIFSRRDARAMSRGFYGYFARKNDVNFYNNRQIMFSSDQDTHHVKCGEEMGGCRSDLFGSLNLASTSAKLPKVAILGRSSLFHSLLF